MWRSIRRRSPFWQFRAPQEHWKADGQARQPSLSACSAKRGQRALIAGRRNSFSARVRRAASISSMCHAATAVSSGVIGSEADRRPTDQPIALRPGQACQPRVAKRTPARLRCRATFLTKVLFESGRPVRPRSHDHGPSCQKSRPSCGRPTLSVTEFPA